MTWTKKTDTQEAREFWSHVDSVAKRVRNSQVHANHRTPQTQTNSENDRRTDNPTDETRPDSRVSETPRP